MYIEDKEDFLSYYLPDYDDACEAWELYERYWGCLDDKDVPEDLSTFKDTFLERLTYQVVCYIGNLYFDNVVLEEFWDSPCTLCSFDINDAIYVNITEVIDYIKGITEMEPKKPINEYKILAELNRDFECKFV